MIELGEEMKVGRGTGRTTYRHPDHAGRLIKIETTPVKGRLRWYERPVKIAPSNQREYDGYTAMIARFGTAPDFVTHVHGWEETDLGRALVVEDALADLDDAISLNGLFKSRDVPYSRQDLAWARQRYSDIADQFCARRVYNHGLKPESVVLGRLGGELRLKLFDFKSIVYRQLISPKYIPKGEHNVQMLTILSVQKKFDMLLERLDATDRSL